MFFELSKIAGFFAMPSNAIAAIIAVGMLLIVLGRVRTGSRWLGVGLVLFFVVGFSPLSNLLLLPLTDRFPAWQAGGRIPDGIIVLGGAVDPESSAVRGSIELNSSAERVLAMLQLAQRFPQAKVLFTGGSGALAGGTSEAPFAEALLQEFGVARERIVVERESRNTAENAILSRQLVKPAAGERWLLVTSSFHMPRAVGAFRVAGFPVEAYPVDWRTRGWRDAARPFSSAIGGFFFADTAVHEWLGLIAYRLTGRTDRLLPAP